MAGRVEQRATTRESYLPSLFTRHHAETHKRTITVISHSPIRAVMVLWGRSPGSFRAKRGFVFFGKLVTVGGIVDNSQGAERRGGKKQAKRVDKPCLCL